MENPAKLSAEARTLDFEDSSPARDSLIQPLALTTPSTSHAPSEAFSTQPTTPSSAAPPQQAIPKAIPSGRPNFAIVPIVPAVPNIAVPSRPSKRISISVTTDTVNDVVPSNAEQIANAVRAAAVASEPETQRSPDSNEAALTLPVKAAPKSWADLVRSMAPDTANGMDRASSVGNGTDTQANGVGPQRTGSLADALSCYSVKRNSEIAKIAFLEPRGLVNTGNMCYMNSVSQPMNFKHSAMSLILSKVLQILVFCIPFYNFLETVNRQAVHNFRSDTPLMDAM